jgi:hypothetical protein
MVYCLTSSASAEWQLVLLALAVLALQHYCQMSAMPLARVCTCCQVQATGAIVELAMLVCCVSRDVATLCMIDQEACLGRMSVQIALMHCRLLQIMLSKDK